MTFSLSDVDIIKFLDKISICVNLETLIIFGYYINLPNSVDFKLLKLKHLVMISEYPPEINIWLTITPNIEFIMATSSDLQYTNFTFNVTIHKNLKYIVLSDQIELDENDPLGPICRKIFNISFDDDVPDNYEEFEKILYKLCPDLQLSVDDFEDTRELYIYARFDTKEYLLI